MPTQFFGGGQGSCVLLSFNSHLAGTGATGGTVVAANLRVGAVSGPMRFLRMRTYYQKSAVEVGFSGHGPPEAGERETSLKPGEETRCV